MSFESSESESKEQLCCVDTTDVCQASDTRRTPEIVTDPPGRDSPSPSSPSTRLTPESDKHSATETSLRHSPNSAFVRVHQAREDSDSLGRLNGLFTPFDKTESKVTDEGAATVNRKPPPHLAPGFQRLDTGRDAHDKHISRKHLQRERDETEDDPQPHNVVSPKKRRHEVPKTHCHKGSIFRPFESPVKQGRSTTGIKQQPQVSFSRYMDPHLPITNYWLTMSRAAAQASYPMPFALSPLNSLQQTVDHYTQIGRSPMFPGFPLGFDTGVSPFRMHLMELQEQQQRKEAELRLRAKRSPETSTVSSSTSFSSGSTEGHKTPERNLGGPRTPGTPDSEPRPLPDSSTVSSNTSNTSNSNSSNNNSPLDLTPSPAAKLTSPLFSSTPRGYPYEHLIPGHVNGASPIHPLGGAGMHPTYLSIGTRRPRDPSKPPPAKKYKCDLCGKAFSRSNTLVTHRVSVPTYLICALCCTILFFRLTVFHSVCLLFLIFFLCLFDLPFFSFFLSYFFLYTSLFRLSFFLSFCYFFLCLFVCFFLYYFLCVCLCFFLFYFFCFLLSEFCIPLSSLFPSLFFFLLPVLSFLLSIFFLCLLLPRFYSILHSQYDIGS